MSMEYDYDENENQKKQPYSLDVQIILSFITNSIDYLLSKITSAFNSLLNLDRSKVLAIYGILLLVLICLIYQLTSCLYNCCICKMIRLLCRKFGKKKRIRQDIEMNLIQN